MRYQEFQMVRLTADITQRWHNLDMTISRERIWPAGSIGTIVHIHDCGRAFEVEFDDDTATVRHDQLKADDPMLVTLPDDWKIKRDDGSIILARPAGMALWMRDNIAHRWHWTDSQDFEFDDLQDATLFKLRWL